MRRVPWCTRDAPDEIRNDVMTTDVHDVIVIGTSAGGVEALCAVVAALPPDLPAAVFVVMHLPAWSSSKLPEILSRCGPLPAAHPFPDERIEHGRIYVAPPDHHLLLSETGRVQLWHGPRENNFRPAINTLFRSAAVAYGPRVTGVILTGNLEDGAAGLWWIKRMEGVSVVQDPEDAEFAQMPRTALWHVNTDYVVKLAELAPTLTRLANGVRHAGAQDQELKT